MAGTSSQKTPIEEDPIIHTPGGEMPDADQLQKHRFQAGDFGDIGASKSEKSGIEPGSSLLPLIFYGIALGISVFFVLRKSKKAKQGIQSLSAEARRALEVDDVPPTRFMGA